ncbi:MAG TPA: hypothetical protein VFA01_02060 [Candidatus Dormibacteraeota bacterium]|nr:hypothetical protein [Candidatus Dormibacteraeota bacterium]
MRALAVAMALVAGACDAGERPPAVTARGLAITADGRTLLVANADSRELDAVDLTQLP